VASTRFPDDDWPIDALAWSPDVNFVRDVMPQWHAALNRGEARNAALVGGSSKARSGRCLGQIRTYAFVGRDVELTYRSWMTALATAATFATRGPLIELTVPSGRVRASARSLVPFDRLEIVCGGEIVADSAPSADLTAALETSIPQARDAWLAARCWRAGELLAHTSPWLHAADGGSATRR
jgi:hypothetical protein